MKWYADGSKTIIGDCTAMNLTSTKCAVLSSFSVRVLQTEILAI